MGIKYVKVYSFELMKIIEDGKRVYMLDKKTNKVCLVNDMKLGDYVKLRNEIAEDGCYEQGRYDFWYIED